MSPNPPQALDVFVSELEFPTPAEGSPPESCDLGKGKSKRRRKARSVFKRLGQARREANERERQRVATLRCAFEGLMRTLPSELRKSQMSRRDVLEQSIWYIELLNDMLRGDESASSTPISESAGEVQKNTPFETTICPSPNSSEDRDNSSRLAGRNHQQSGGLQQCHRPSTMASSVGDHRLTCPFDNSRPTTTTTTTTGMTLQTPGSNVVMPGHHHPSPNDGFRPQPNQFDCPLGKGIIKKMIV